MLWLDGQIYETTQAPFDFADRGLLLADGLFETLLVVGGTPFLLDAHLDRLMKGAATIGMACERAEVARAIAALAAQTQEPAVIRVTVTRGTGPRGLRPPLSAQPRIFATAAAWSPALAFRSQTLALSTIRRNAFSPLSQLKSLSYLDNVLALEEAARAGADDALMLSTNGAVACTSVANLFALVGSQLVTPPPSDGVLAGTLRGCVMALARDCGLNVREESLSLNDLRAAEVVFSTNSVRLISAVTQLDAAPLGKNGNADALKTLVIALRQRIAAACGCDPFAKEATSA